MPFESEADRLAEQLRRELEQERQAHQAADEARARLEGDLASVRKELDAAVAELARSRPPVRLPLGWFRVPVIGAIPVALAAVALAVGAVTGALQTDRRIRKLEEERDRFSRMVESREADRRAGAVMPTSFELGCLSACGCPDGQGCSGEICREGVTPAHCCERGRCPAGAPCQRFDGSESTCPAR